DARHRQAVVGEVSASALRLRRGMAFEIPPALHRLFIAPDRKRKDLAFVGKAGEALDGNEPVYLFQLGLEGRREIEIVLPAPGGRNDFEDDRDHEDILNRRRVPTHGNQTSIVQSGRKPVGSPGYPRGLQTTRVPRTR